MASQVTKLFVLCFIIPRIVSKEANQRDQNNIYKDRKNKGYKDTESEIQYIEYKEYTRHHNDDTTNVNKESHMIENTMVTDGTLFPFMVAVMKGSKFVCAGALIDESWVLTAANGLYLMEDSIKFIRVRLGSINYKKGGELAPIKYMEIHPYFNSHKPNYDLALVMLATPMRYTPSLRSVRLQMKPKEVTGTHFIETSWPDAKVTKHSLKTIDTLNRHLLSLTHLHLIEHEECDEELKEIEASTDGVLCLETGVNYTCKRNVGAPVVFNGALWGIISSWKPVDCDVEDSVPIFATLVSAVNVSSWIHATVHGNKWHPKYADSNPSFLESFSRVPDKPDRLFRRTFTWVNV